MKKANLTELISVFGKTNFREFEFIDFNKLFAMYELNFAILAKVYNGILLSNKLTAQQKDYQTIKVLNFLENQMDKESLMPNETTYKNLWALLLKDKEINPKGLKAKEFISEFYHSRKYQKQ